MSSAKMARADSKIWVLNKQTIGTYRLIVVVFEYGAFLQHPTKCKWEQCRACKMNNICGANELTKPPQAWTADNLKRE